MDISQKAMLASLHISQWCARKHDKQVSQEVNDKYGSCQAGRFNKILATKASLKQIQAAVGAARTYHLEQTLAWGERGERLLPSKNYTFYCSRMRGFKQDFEQAVRAFVDDYHTMLFEAKKTLGGLFNRADYPEPQRLYAKFAFATVISPVPTAGDFRVSLSQNQVAAIRKDIEQRVHTASQTASRDLWQRLYAVVARMAERLSDPEAVFRNSLVGNIIALTELLPRLNVYDDPGLEAMRRQIQSRLCQYSPLDLRQDKQVRSQAAADAQSVLAAMGSYMEAA